MTGPPLDPLGRFDWCRETHEGGARTAIEGLDSSMARSTFTPTNRGSLGNKRPLVSRMSLCHRELAHPGTSIRDSLVQHSPTATLLARFTHPGLQRACLSFDVCKSYPNGVEDLIAGLGNRTAARAAALRVAAGLDRCGPRPLHTQHRHRPLGQQNGCNAMNLEPVHASRLYRGGTRLGRERLDQLDARCAIGAGHRQP